MSRVKLRLMLLTTALSAAFVAVPAHVHGGESSGKKHESRRRTMTEAVSRAIKNGEPKRMTALSKLSVQLTGVLVAERLPQGGSSADRFMVEFKASSEQSTFRFPVVMEREPAGGADTPAGAWGVGWAPKPVYTKALVDRLNGSLTSMPDSKTAVWLEQTRTPSFPVIVADSSIVTPFGKVGSDAPGPTSNTLSRHASRWLRGAMRGDGSAASADLIFGPKVNWKRAHRVIYQLASNGMYRLHFIGKLSDQESNKPRRSQLRVTSALAPVRLGGGKTELPSLRIGFQGVKDRDLLAATIRGAELSSEFSPPEGCPDKATFCAAQPEQLRELFLDLGPSEPESDWPPSLAIAAFSHSLEIQQVVKLLHLAAAGTKLPTSQWMLTSFGPKSGDSEQ